jgi:prepilin-type N-terminal cleavage/methylation domain-containing protein
MLSFKLNSWRRGFTLIEVLACMGVIAVGLVTALAIRNNNFRQSDATRSKNRAVEYAAPAIERLAIEYQQTGLIVESRGRFDDAGLYRWEANARDVEIKDVGPMAEISLIVRYPTPDGGDSFTITRIVEKRDEQRP